MAPFSVYAVDMVGISQTELGYLYTINGLLVVSLQIPFTKILSKYAFTTQLALGSVFYILGYGFIGITLILNFITNI